MQVPWSRFCSAYETYPEWQALSLWIRTAFAARRRLLPEVLRALRRRCPEFLATEALTPEPNLLGFRLLEWVHSTIFRYAKREGWLNALTFYGVRHVRSEAYWALWDLYENEPSKAAIRGATTFEKWKQLALAAEIGNTVSYSEAEWALEKYIDLEAMAHWVKPLLASGTKLPQRIVHDIKSGMRSSNQWARRVPGDAAQRTPENWSSLIRAAKKNSLRFGTANTCRDTFLKWARSHPRHARLTIYGKLWSCERPEKWTGKYPSFRHWQLDAEHYIDERAGDVSSHRRE